MVVKTEICNFSEHKIYPGKGIKIITKDARLYTFLCRKSLCMFLNKVKSNKIRWATAWRRANKKVKAEDVQKRRRKRAQKAVREIVGMDLQTITSLQKETTEQRTQMRQRAIQDIKDRNRKAKGGKTKGKK